MPLNKQRPGNIRSNSATAVITRLYFATVRSGIMYTKNAMIAHRTAAKAKRNRQTLTTGDVAGCFNDVRIAQIRVMEAMKLHKDREIKMDGNARDDIINIDMIAKTLAKLTHIKYGFTNPMRFPCLFASAKTGATKIDSGTK